MPDDPQHSDSWPPAPVEGDVPIYRDEPLPPARYEVICGRIGGSAAALTLIVTIVLMRYMFADSLAKHPVATPYLASWWGGAHMLLCLAGTVLGGVGRRMESGRKAMIACPIMFVVTLFFMYF